MSAPPDSYAEPMNEIVARDPGMIEVLETAQAIARHDAAVLITGETGTGKEVIARMIHRYSNRSSRPWVDVNCAALPEHLVESELFGYEKGAFSGADSVKQGLFELANGGTLFLDEIGEIDPKVQVKLLRVLDSVPYYRLGGCRKVSVNSRLVAATNRNLEAAVRSGAFRSDLYHRISEVRIHVPPLRERPQDIVALAEYFLAQRRPDAGFTAEALELLSQFEWPGNVRELRNLIVKLGILTSHREITAQDVRSQLSNPPTKPDRPGPVPFAGLATLSEMERLMILQTLKATGGNQSLAAAQLGIPRRTFCRKLTEHQITKGRRKGLSAGSTLGLPDNCRAELNIPVTVRTKEGCCFVANAKNLSVGGLGLQNVEAPLSATDELTLTFSLPGSGRRIELKAVVVWCQPDRTVGTKFIQLGPSKTELLRNWIVESTSTLLPPTSDTSQLEPDILEKHTASI
jgi:transcriptional regulator with GAF, ATPase, and Fis domain